MTAYLNMSALRVARHHRLGAASFPDAVQHRDWGGEASGCDRRCGIAYSGTGIARESGP
jgi:hypothetical protein